MKRYVKDLKPGERVETFFAVKFKKPPKAYAHGHMFELRISDRTEEMTAKYWGDDDAGAVRRLYDSFSNGDVVFLTGTAGEYRGALELGVSKVNGDTIRLTGEDEWELEDFVDKSPKDVDAMLSRLREVRTSVSDPHLRALLDSFFGDEGFVEDFAYAPASMHYHQNYLGGLLEHTLNVVRIVEAVLGLYPQMDRNLAVAGALLHDIGKVWEFRVSTSIDVTEEGMLIGHVALGEKAVGQRVQAIDGFPALLANKLSHIMLSHHGKKEYGSPKEPQLPEALAVYYADETDAKVALMVRTKEGASTEDPWTWSKRTGHVFLK